MTKLSPEQRGYGQTHRTRRGAIAPMVEAGMVRCVRCSELIQPGTPWGLGHVDGYWAEGLLRARASPLQPADDLPPPAQGEPAVV